MIGIGERSSTELATGVVVVTVPLPRRNCFMYLKLVHIILILVLVQEREYGVKEFDVQSLQSGPAGWIRRGLSWPCCGHGQVNMSLVLDQTGYISFCVDLWEIP